ncbi:MAG: tetratricopeptide repeat protein [Planctomycetales bacterium]|nr:tetratricopeptide repeat protein [Planctomycetales bacterium]
MAHDTHGSDSGGNARPTLAPLSPASRHRLQKVFERGLACVEKGDHDYAHQLLAQCVVEDPASDIYLKGFLDNLRKKYGNSKKGAKLAALKIKSHRTALSKASEKGDWTAAFTAGCAALALNPWDVTTLLALAAACGELHIDECRLIYLRAALDVDGKNPTVNREAALALSQMGQFDQAIACWHRVEQAKPHDEEALQAISRLSVEKTIRQGGYDPELLGGSADGENRGGQRTSVAGLSRGKAPSDHDAPSDDDAPPLSPEERLKAKIAADPADIESYLGLVDVLLHEDRLDEAAPVLQRAAQAAGGGDLRVHQRMEILQIRAAQRQVEQAHRHFEHEETDEARELYRRAKLHAQQVELEIVNARAQREPGNPRLQWDLGVHLKRAGKLKEAIQAFQAARSDAKRKASISLELGECFQKIEQYKLALSNYEQAITASDGEDDETRKLALYRAGVLATGLRELDRAERHLSELAGLDFGFRDVAERLDKLNRLRNSG